MKIIAIKVLDSGEFYINFPENRIDALKYIVNGEIMGKSFCSGWYIVKSKPVSLQMKLPQEHVNERYELIDISMQSDKIPINLNIDTVTYYNELSYCTQWKSEFSHLQSLYCVKYDLLPEKLEDVSFELEIIAEVHSIKYPELSYSVQKTIYAHEGLTTLTQKDVTYQILDKLIFPSPILPQRPCKYTSEQTYKIVRQYIKQNINYEVAEITSDYNFCFTVKKKIPLEKPEPYQVDKNLGKGKPKLKTIYRNSRSVEVFEMTYSPENYKGYTPIKEFIGDSMEDLKNKIDTFCYQLITEINRPLKDCPTCEGKGVIDL